jgi:ABC-type glycerol-3-phosphate transport system permease component
MAAVDADALVVRPRRRRPRRRAALLFVLMAAIAVVMLYPFWFMVNTSLESNDVFLHGGPHSLASWRILFDSLPVGR